MTVTRLREHTLPAVPQIADVVIAGAGPAGMTAALASHTHGLRAVVVEARPRTPRRGNVVEVRGSALADLERLGATDLRSGRTASSVVDGATTISLAGLEGSLRELGSARGIPQVYDMPVTGIRNEADRATALLADGSTIEGRYLINATGGRIGVEHDLGMGLEYHGDWSYFTSARYPAQDHIPSGRSAGVVVDNVWPELPADSHARRLAVQRAALPDAWGSNYWLVASPRDGVSVVTFTTSRLIGTAGLDGLARHATAPARYHGILDAPVDGPWLLRGESASVANARAGSVLAIGDAAGRAHPRAMNGTQLAVEDGLRAAHAIADSTEAAGDLSRIERFSAETLAAHAQARPDAFATMADDPLAHLQTQGRLRLG